MMDNPNPKAYRLPTHTRPTHYDIHIDARIERKEVPGKVVIGIEIKESTPTIELHARDMTLNSARLDRDGKSLEAKISQDEEREMAALRFGESLEPGKATLTIEYDGQVSPGLEALYLAKDGPEVCLCTQCEETDARGIFPCWDEPTFKATFAWNVTTDAEMTVLANGPLSSVEDGPNPELSTQHSALSTSKTWRFKATKPMSSYLVALVIGDVAGTDVEKVAGTPISVWGMKGKEQMGDFAHRFTAELLPWYEEYFGVPYHFDKYDQVAVPGFSAGAMENSGLVLFRQSLLLMDPRTASLRQEEAIALVVAHEFAHMWFGNLVTMAWWDDLWLNEAFAEWMAYKVTDTLAPQYEVWNDFQQGKNAALVADAQQSTHPIYSPVETPAQASELFDVITYQKGSSVMRMLENYLGHEPFRNGLRTYMKEFSEDNAVGADLWRHLQAASDQPVMSIMESWITQDGYPVISISLDGSQLKLSQRRFFSSPGVKEDDPQIWQAPLVIKYEDDSGEHEARYLLTEREATLPIDTPGEIKWLYANVGEIGFYRQNPDAGLLRRTLGNLNKLSSLEQVGLLGDQWALVRNSTHRIGQFLDVLSAMSRSDYYNITEEVVGHLHNLEKLLSSAGDMEAVQRFRAWVDGAYSDKLAALGFEGKDGEDKNDTLRRASVIAAMTSLAHNRDAIEEATRLADREAEDPASVDPNVAGTLVAAAAHFGDAARFDRYREIYEGRKGKASPQEVNRYLYSFTQFRDPELLARAFGLMDEDVIPQEGIGPVVRQMFTMLHAAPPAWEYMKSRWPTIRNLGDQWTGSLVLASGQLPESYRDDLVKFYDANLNGVAERSYARALETIDQMAEFKARTKDDLVGWFKSR
jgi:puromycin-sensitive aminopeptidase